MSLQPLTTTASCVVARSAKVMVCPMLITLFVRETFGSVFDFTYGRSAADVADVDSRHARH